MTNILLCGGNGTRLWPVSRTLMPKQFVKLFGERSLFQMTVERNAKICESRMIVSNTEQYFLAQDQLEELEAHGPQSERPESTFFLEPIGRNTAPAIALACMQLPSEELVLVTPSDHLIKDEAAYAKAVAEAKRLAEEGNLVTFGIRPSSPETGFGYIEAEGNEVKAFHEKPDRETAERYLQAGNCYWNAGMFCFQAGVFLKELRTYAPEIYESGESALEKSVIHDDLTRIRHEEMLRIPEESIDYAVMEKSRIVKVVPADMGWSDLGSFDALAQEFETDENGNTLNEKLIAVDSKNNFVFGNDRLIATVDVEDLIVVDTPDALLVGKKGNSQKIKKIVKELKSRESELHHTHLTAHRPWGTYTILEEGDKYKIKRIVVKPGKRLSLQKHFHRSEHWIVVEGTALVTIGDKELLVRPNESTYIPMGEIHRLENPGKMDVVLIEAQVGEYLGEDDIVRVDDDFERS